MSFFIGESFIGEGVNAAHINIILGDKNSPAGNAFVNILGSPTQGHCPFMVVAQPNIPVQPATLYTNKAAIINDFHGRATWGASQAGIAQAVTESLLQGILPPEAATSWVIITANWVNPQCNNLDEVFANNYKACLHAIKSALAQEDDRVRLEQIQHAIRNPFYTPSTPLQKESA